MPACSLEGSWIEVFRAGEYGERGKWTAEDLDRLAAAYDPRTQAAPIVLGHPADDAPALGWVKRLRRAGESLWAQLEKVDPALEALLRAGRFAPRSVALYKSFPLTGGPYLRHVGFLGAAPPAVKGLAPVRLAFAEGEFFRIDSECRPIVPNAFSSHRDPAAGALRLRPGQAAGLNVEMSLLGDNTMAETKSKLESFIDHLRSFFLPDPPTATPPGEGSADPSPAPSSATPAAGAAGLNSVGAAAFAERLAVLEQRLEGVASAKESAEKKLAEAEAAKSHAQVANFIETLRSQGRFPPMYERWGVCRFMERLANVDSCGFARHEAQEAEEAKEAEEKAQEDSLLVWFQEFLSQLPAVIHFGELAADAGHRSPAAGHRAPVVRFSEPARGMSVDPASVELAERAEALAAEESIAYAEALARLREERRAPTTA
jgi:hypothetical protein